MAVLQHSNISLCTYNCRSYKNSTDEINELCEQYDFVLLQEHWLLPNELSLLSQLNCKFVAVAHSSVEIDKDILVGRPYGGTAIMYNKCLASSVTSIETHEPRLTAVTLSTNVGPKLIVCAYMPTDTGDGECIEEFISVCSAITALYEECNAVHLIVAGDFNCHIGSRLYDSFRHLIQDNKLLISDETRLVNAFTYCNDAGTASSWIDHVLCSAVIDKHVSSVDVLTSFVTSDHKPLCVTFDGISALMPSCSNIRSAGNTMEPNSVLVDWSRVQSSDIAAYQLMLDTMLSSVSIPSELLLESVDIAANADRVELAIDNYYESVMSCIRQAGEQCLPVKRGSITDNYVMPGWNDIVHEKHQVARDAFLEWVMLGKPRQGPEFISMKRTRAQFKLALRYCKQHEEKLRADNYANSLADKDYTKFWQHIRKASNGKSTSYATCVGGCSDEESITAMWQSQFEQLYNSVPVQQDKELLFVRLTEASTVSSCNLTVHDIRQACSKQKDGKAVGMDGVAMEAIRYGGSRLLVHVCTLFNMFFRFGIVPKDLMKCVIIPLVKNKNGDISDVNNYRAISISTAMSKLCEASMYDWINTRLKSSDYQFGFKSGHSTAICTSALKNVVDYYTERGSYVFACFLDISKAFDRVNYWKLFHMLLDDGIDMQIVRLLAYWYSKQEMCVKWHGRLSSPFALSNGTRQGGVLSPLLFARYIWKVLAAIVGAGIGCNVGGMFINVLAYADDIVILAPAWRALQQLIDILSVNAKDIDLKINASKTVCLVFQPKNRARRLASIFPQFEVDGVSLPFVQQFKYLGHIIASEMYDDDDIQREIRSMFIRTNVLARKFWNCSNFVKVQLFKSYCLCMYDVALWTRYRIGKLSKLHSCYNRCIKTFFKYKRRDSMSQILVDLSLPSFEDVISASRARFFAQWNSCVNSVVNHLVSVTTVQ